jgi:hypothetical protein
VVPNKTFQNGIPTSAPPSPQFSAQTYETETYTYFTVVGQAQNPLYNGDREWATLTLTLETAGTVEVSTKRNLLPLLSGKGIALRTGVPRPFTLPKGTRLYIAASAINRVTVTIEQQAWQEQQLGAMVQGTSSLHAMLQPITGAMGALVQRLVGGGR